MRCWTGRGGRTGGYLRFIWYRVCSILHPSPGTLRAFLVLLDIAGCRSFEFHTLKGHELLGRVSGADALGVTTLVDTYLGKGPQSQLNSHTQKHEESEEELMARMRGILNQSSVVLFMKGEPDNPRCGFSRKAVNLLREQNVAFTHFDILEDETVRQGDTLSSFDIYIHSLDDRIEEIERLANLPAVHC